MSSAKVLLCDLCLILLALSVVVADDSKKSTINPKDSNSTKGKCSCGGFPTQTPDVGAPPLLSQSPDLALKCDDESEETCSRLCVALATAAKAQGPSLICNKLKNAEELKLSAFYKICEKPWKYLENMTESHPLCCVDGKETVCASAAATMGNCSCGSFVSQTPGVSDLPVLSKISDPVHCDDSGESACKKSCIAQSSAYTAPDQICNQLTNTSDVKIAAFYKTCEKPWSPIENTTAPQPICCENGKLKECQSTKS